MLTDPIRDVETDGNRKVFVTSYRSCDLILGIWFMVCDSHSGEFCGEQQLDGHRLKTPSPTGKRYAY